MSEDRPLNPDGSVWVPAFPGQRPPFQRGNRVSVGNRGPLKHGAKSPRVYLPLAREIESDLRQHAQLEYLWEPEFRDLTSAYCTALAREELYAAWIDQMESVEEWARPSEGRVSSPAEEHLELLSRVAHLAEALGLTPALRDEVREAIAKARTRIELRRQRAAKKPSREELLKAIRDANYPGERNSDRDGLR